MKTETKWYVGLGAAFTAVVGWLYLRPRPVGGPGSPLNQWLDKVSPLNALQRLAESPSSPAPSPLDTLQRLSVEGPPAGTRGTSPAFVGEESNGKTVETHVGETVFVRLPSNPSTGYRWEIVQVSPALGTPKREDYGASSPGAPGWTRFIWDMTPAMAGTQKIQLAYVGPSGSTAKAFSLALNVGT